MSKLHNFVSLPIFLFIYAHVNEHFLASLKALEFPEICNDIHEKFFCIYDFGSIDP